MPCDGDTRAVMEESPAVRDPGGDILTAPPRITQAPSAKKKNSRKKVQTLTETETGDIVVSRWQLADWFLGTTRGQFLILAGLAIVLNLGGAFVWMGFTNGNDDYTTSFEDSVWFSWGMFFDPGTHTGLKTTDPTEVRIVGVIFSILGFTYNLLVLGIIVELARVKLDAWKRQRSKLVLNGHVLVVGWTEKTIFLLREMIFMSTNKGSSNTIVILSERDEMDMWSEIHHHFPDRKSLQGQKIVARHGSPYEVDDLVKVSAASAQEIVVLGRSGGSRESDLGVIRIVVALAALPDSPCGNVTAEVRDAENTNVIDMVMEHAEGIVAREAVNRVLCLMAADPLIGDCFSMLLSFVAGEELYCVNLDGTLADCATFAEIQSRLDDGVCIGIRRSKNISSDSISTSGDTSATWISVIAPNDDEPIRPGDQLFIVAREEKRITQGWCCCWRSTGAGALQDMLSLGASAESTPTPHRHSMNSRYDGSADTIIIVGWANDMADLLRTLDSYVQSGTNVHILADIPEAEQELRIGITFSNVPSSIFEHLTVTHHTGSTTSKRSLVALPFEEASVVFVLAEDIKEFDDDAAASDAACLACTVTIHELCNKNREKPCRLVCEVLDPNTERMLSRNTMLNSIATFFHSNALETGLFAMASSERAVFNTLVGLLQPGGASAKMVARPLSMYLTAKEKELDVLSLSFWDLWARMRVRQEIILGWRRKMGVLELNPKIRDQKLPFCTGDQVIVIARTTA
eukprot:TRINITY_DN11294_c0_g2_i1.p1 TRINITY_DN11294_c0_g2~~TRINITY_DN11294_c0_g2_i1.p1  ORF type:complete len:787 (-),score=143.39 TRINITY_DN11294_c0_g2_i1:42-2276(-)